MTRCSITDLPEDQCAHCRKLPDPGAESSQHLGPWFEARYSGRCAECGERYHEGDEIRADGHGHGGYLCEPCGGGE